jgi:hypothetical protein
VGVHLTFETAQSGPDIWDAVVALGSAIVGAAAGAIPAFILAKRGSKEVLERDRTARLEAAKTVGMRVHVKLGTIVNSILTLQKQLNAAIANPPQPGAEYWQMVEPVVGFAGEEGITFEAEEVAIFIAAGKLDYAEALLLLARRHAVHAEVMREYAARRDQLRKDMPTPAAVDGRTGTTALTREDFLRLRPQMVSLNSLIEQLLGHLDEDSVLAINLAQDFGTILRAHFKDPRYPAFVIPDDPATAPVRRYARDVQPPASPSSPEVAP